MEKNYLKVFNNFPVPAVLLRKSADGFVVEHMNDFFRRNQKNNFACSGCSLSALLQEISKKEPYCFSGFIENAQKPKGSSQTAIFRTSFFSENDSPEYWQAEISRLNQVEEDPSLLVFHDKTSEIRAVKRQKKLEEELQLQRQGQKHFVGNNSDGLYALDIEGNFLHVNEGLSKLAELPEEELLQSSFLPFCAPESRQRVYEHFIKVLQGENQEFEEEFISARNNRLVLQISIAPMKSGEEITGVFGIAKNVTPLRRTEEELQRKEKKFQALVQEGTELMVILNLDGTYKFVSENVQNILGNSPAFYIGKSAFDFIHSEDKDRVLGEFAKLEQQKQIKISSYRFSDAVGKWRWLESTAVNMKDEPLVEGVVVTSREVTELIEQNRQIDQLHERYKLAATATNDLVYDWDLVTDEVIRFCTPGGKYFGYNPAEISKREFWPQNIHPEEIDNLRKQLERTLEDYSQGQVKTQYRFKRKDGSYAEVIDRATIVRDEKGKPLRLIGATSDISDIVESQNALKMSNARFSFAMRATKELIWDWDIEKGKVIRSESFRKIFGHDAEANAGQDLWLEKIHEGDRERVKNSLEEALQKPEVRKWRQEYRILKKDNIVAYVIDRGFILRNEKSVPVRMVGAVLDVTESREMIREIKKQNEALKKVAWEQAHVVRGPLARLKALVNVLSAEEQTEWTQEELLYLIKESADELDEVILNIIRKTEEVGEKVK